MITRKTVLEQTELNCQAGILGVMIAFLLVEGETEIDRKLHRTAIPLDADPVQQMASVNAHLGVMDPPIPAVSEVDIDFVVSCHAMLKQRLAQP